MSKFLLPVLITVFACSLIYYNVNKDAVINTKENSTKKEWVLNRVSSDERVGSKAPNIKLYDLNGKLVSLEDYKGKKVLLNFWASWCGPCRSEMPLFQAMHTEDSNKYIILTVNIGENTDTVKKYFSENKFDFKVILDTTQETAEIYRISAIPTSFFIDEKGTIQNIRTGVLSKDEIEHFFN